MLDKFKAEKEKMAPEKKTLVMTHLPRFLSLLEEEIYSERCCLDQYVDNLFSIRIAYFSKGRLNISKKKELKLLLLRTSYAQFFHHVTFMNEFSKGILKLFHLQFSHLGSGLQAAVSFVGRREGGSFGSCGRGEWK